MNDQSSPVTVIVRRRARSTDTQTHDPWHPVHERLKQIMADCWTDSSIRASCVLLGCMAAWSRRVINLRDPELQARELMSIIDRIDSPPDPVITVADVWKASPERFRQDEVQTVRVLLASFATNYDPPNSKATSTNREILMIQRGLDNDDHQTRQKVAATAFARLAKAI